MIHDDSSTSPRKLTKRQQLVLDFISSHITQWGYPPTIREIGDNLQIKSTNGVNDHLKALERKGYLVRQDAKSRALRPVHFPGAALPAAPTLDIEQDDEELDLGPTCRIPLVGRIAAGEPIPALEHAEDILVVSQSLLGKHNPDDIFGLRVKGQSMIEAGILDKDIIFVKAQRDARDGEMVAAMVDGEATVKYLHREGERIRLQPANSAMEPIYVHASQSRETAILGRVIGVWRKMQ